MPADTLRAPTPSAPTPQASQASRRERWPSFAAPAVFGQPLSRGVALAAVALLTLVSLSLRVRGLHVQYWVDEGISVGVAGHHLSQIPSLMRQDGSPPLYYLLLHVWMSVRGTGEVATHELSLIFALLSIPVAYWAGCSLFRRRAGLACAVLAAGAPYLTTYAQETRMYSLLALLALLVAAAFVHAFVRRDRRYLPLFAASLTAALYTHNWALFLGVMTGLAFLAVLRESAPGHERRSLWRDGLIAFGSVAVLYAPWLPTVLYQARHTGAPWALPPVLWSLTQGPYSLVGGRGAAIALLFGGGTGLLALRSAKEARGGALLAAKCLLLMGAGTLVLGWVFAKITPAWDFRYLAVIVGPLIVLFGLGLARAGRVGLLALALVACFWVLDPVSTKPFTKSNVAAVVAKVRPKLAPGALVLSTQPEQVPVLAYYLPRSSHFGTPLGPVADPRIVDWPNALSKLRHSSVRSVLMPMIRTLAPGERVLLVLPVGLPSSPLWMKLIKRDSTQWASFLGHDPSLRRLTSSSVHSGAAGVAVQITVFARRAQTGQIGPHDQAAASAITSR